MWWQKWHSKNYACYVLFIYLFIVKSSEIWNQWGFARPSLISDYVKWHPYECIHHTRTEKKIIKAIICELLWAVTFITFQIHSCYHIPCWWFIKHDITSSKTLQSNTFLWGFCTASLALCITGLLLQVHSNIELNLTELHC